MAKNSRTQVEKITRRRLSTKKKKTGPKKKKPVPGPVDGNDVPDMIGSADGEEQVRMNFSFDNEHGSDEEVREVQEETNKAASSSRTLVRAQQEGESSEIIAGDIRTPTNVPFSPYHSQSDSSDCSWFVKSCLTEGDLLMNEAVNDESGSRQGFERRNLNNQSAEQMPDNHHFIDLDADTDRASVTRVFGESFTSTAEDMAVDSQDVAFSAYDELETQPQGIFEGSLTNCQEDARSSTDGNEENRQSQFPASERNSDSLDNNDARESPGSEPSRNTKVRKPRKKMTDFDPEARCIVKFSHILRQLTRQFDSESHGRFGCGIQDQEIIGVIQDGFRTKFIMGCKKCHLETDIWSELPDDDYLDINRSVVVATHSIGKGHAALEEWTANLGMYCPPYNKYQQLSVEIDEIFVETASEVMKKNGEEVSAIAKEKGRLIDGIPTCPVVVDGSWSVRSYGNKARAHSGMAVGISPWTKKVLFAGYRNQYCYNCQRVANGTLPPHNHRCWVNWPQDRSILGVESDIIVEGFKNSQKDHGLMYTEMIGDCDSNVHTKVQQANPNNDKAPVRKIDCELHIGRNRNGEISRAIVALKPGRSREGQELKKIAFNRTGRISKGVAAAARHWRNEEIEPQEKVINLKKDLDNVVDHVFGNHEKCADYFCDGQGKPGEVNLVPQLQKYKLYDPLREALQKWSTKATHLLEHQTTNYAESFNALLAKYNYHKGVNVQFKGVYPSRISMAVIQFSNQALGSTFHYKLKKQTPEVLTAMEQRRQAKNVYNRKYRKKHKFSQLAAGQTDLMDKSPDYGKRPETLDMSPEDFAEAVKAHLTILEQWYDNHEKIEEDTRDNPDELSLKKRRILCSEHFGNICRMKEDTATAKMVAKILYPTKVNDPKRLHDSSVKDRIAAELPGFMKCGLFIHPEIKFLGTKPDGLLPNGDIIIIHCPFNISEKTVVDAMNTDKLGLQKIFKLVGVDNDGNHIRELNRNHSLYYEVVGSLAITGKNSCLLVIATAKDSISINVNSDDVFWRSTIMPRLRSFYENFMIPEIVDSRHMRHMSLRDDKRTTSSAPEVIPDENRPVAAEIVGNDDCDDNYHDLRQAATRHRSVHTEIRDRAGDDLECLLNLVESGGEINQVENRSIVEMLIATELGPRELNILKGKDELESDHFDVLWQIIGDATASLYESRAVLLLQHSPDLIEPIDPGQKHIQILSRGGRHWVCAYYDTKRIYIYDSLPSRQGPSIDPYYRILRRLFPHYSFDQLPVIFPPVQIQMGGTDCGVFAAAIAVSLVYSLDPVEVRYNQDLMRPHLLSIYQTKVLEHFPLSSNCHITIPDLYQNVENEWNRLFQHHPNA